MSALFRNTKFSSGESTFRTYVQISIQFFLVEHTNSLKWIIENQVITLERDVYLIQKVEILFL